MGVQVDSLPHSCGTSGGLKVFQQEDGTHTGYCFACSTYVPDPYGDKPAGYRPPQRSAMEPERVIEQLEEINGYPSLARPDRKLGAATAKHYGVRTSLSEFNGTDITAAYYPYYVGSELKAYKVKTTDKHMFCVGSTRGVDPFGWHLTHQADHYRLFITEGEDDAQALFKVLKSRWKGERYPAVISLVNGSSSVVKSLAHKAAEIQRTYKEVILVYDNDPAGQKAVMDTLKVLPNCKTVSLPLKDANDMVKAERDDELFRLVMFESYKKVSGKSYRSSELWDKAMEPPKQGLDWPWSSLTQILRGRRRGEVYYLGAGVCDKAPFNREVV